MEEKKHVNTKHRLPVIQEREKEIEKETEILDMEEPSIGVEKRDSNQESMEIDDDVVKDLKAGNKRGRGTSTSPMSSPPNKKEFIQPESGVWKFLKKSVYNKKLVKMNLFIILKQRCLNLRIQL